MIFVVIPALNEAANLRALLPVLAAAPQICRVCVVDGGSTDETLQVARAAGVHAVDGPAMRIERNRGAQMNAGVGALQRESTPRTDDILWFLHADARPTEVHFARLVRAAKDPRRCGGNFALRFQHRGAAARGFELLARLLRAAGMYYGDSGIWLRAGTFRALGGYQAWPLFEDYDLARRLEAHARRHHRRTCSLRPPLPVSARRWKKSPARWLGLWALFQLLFWLRVPPAKLARRYHE